MFNLNPKLIDLLIVGLKQTGQLKTNKWYDLDYDNQVQPTEKYDDMKTYKLNYGYQPGFAPFEICLNALKGGMGTAKQNTSRAEYSTVIFKPWVDCLPTL
ncbi:MAG: hypothetical protein GYB55_15335 [Cytophagales bacterium]|uniref:hypothetical protein n=1 Tax=Cyclobacterium marinum TaxID=104 RepID=UPI0030D7780A|nr:hypothetical protein [Cytophagales bacterium]